MSDSPSPWWNKKIVIPFFRHPMWRKDSPFNRTVNRVIKWIFLLLLSSFLVWRVWLGHEVNVQFAKIRAAGLPTTGAELNLWPRRVPDAQNGALVMAQAFELLRTFPDKRAKEIESGDFIYRTNNWSSETNKLIEDYVQTNTAAIAKAREALTFSVFRYPVDYAYGVDTEFPLLAKLRTLAQVAALRAVLDAEQGRPEDWPQYVDFELQLAATLNDEPDLSSHFARNGIIRMAARSIERSLNHGIPTNDECRKLQEAFASAGSPNTLPQALTGERAMMVPVFRMSWAELQNASETGKEGDKIGKPQRLSGKPAWFIWVTGFLERDLNFYLQTMGEGIWQADQPFPEALAFTNSFSAASDTAQNKFYVESSILLVFYPRVFEREATFHAQINLAVTSLAVERFRLARGRLPADLRELIPEFLDEVPTDPFDGAALRFHRLPRGYVVYSIGADGHDDGGREPPERRKSGDTNTYDITFTVETP